MSRDPVTLAFPDHVTAEHRALLIDLAERNDAAHGEQFVGLILSGSGGRGLAHVYSDLDVCVILDGAPHGRKTTRSPEVDEIPITLTDLETVPPFGSGGWWYRWSFAWAPVLFDRTNGRLDAAAHAQATVTPGEADAILLDHDRLDGWLNYAYRALKSDRAGRPFEARLDAAESMPWLLDTIFTLAGRVRPYDSYLPWELREHPLADWSADVLLGLLERTLDGDPAAIRETFERVEAGCRAFDADRGNTRATDVIAEWGSELELFRR